MPVPRIADCGRNTTGVSNSAPREPVFVSVNVPPESSSGFSLLLRVRAARSAICAASSARSSSPASRMTGVSRPRSVSTAMHMFSVAG